MQLHLFHPHLPELARIAALREVVAEARRTSPDFTRKADTSEWVECSCDECTQSGRFADGVGFGPESATGERPFYDLACSDTDWCACEFCYAVNYPHDC